MVLCKSIFTINRIAFILVFVLACSFTTCVRSIRHDQDSAAQRAVEFARAAMIQRDYSLAYQQLSPKWRKELTVEALKDLVNRMHPTNWPRTIAATEYEPLPGRQAMKIFLYAREHGEDFVYMFVMEGTADTGSGMAMADIMAAENQHDKLVGEAMALKAFNDAFGAGNTAQMRSILAANPSIGYEMNSSSNPNAEGSNVSVSAEVGGPQAQTPIVPCTINVNVSGASGQVLTDATKEMTRIFRSGGNLIDVEFNLADKPNPGSPNLVIVTAFTGEAAAAIKRQGRSVDPNSILGVTPTIGKSVYVNQTRIGAYRGGSSESRASLGTMIGRIGAHELFQHRLLGILPEGTMRDVTSSRVSARELRTVFTTRFNLNPLTAAMLNNQCRR